MYECTQDNAKMYFNYKIINDPIYGCIGLSELEMALLDTMAMQRLRHIKQMGFSEYVFPGGEHTRFTHSLGVLYIMGRMCDVLYRNGDIGHEDMKKMRVAALLHDVGHYPFSHLGERVYSYIDSNDICSIVKSDEVGNLLNRISSHRKRKLVDHEHLGAKIIMKDPEISQLLKQAHIDAGEIGDIITGKIVVDQENSVLYAQMMHSSLDADRFDYLMRDSAQAGVNFGKVELDYIINNIRKASFRIKNLIKTPVDSLAIDAKAQSAVEHFLMGRYFHYSRTVNHKASIAFDASAQLLFYMTIQDPQSEINFKKFDDIIDAIGTDEFYMFTDELVWHAMYRHCLKAKEVLDKELWKVVGHRKKPVTVLNYKNIIPKHPTLSDKQTAYDERFEKVVELVENEHKSIAVSIGIDDECLGYVKSVISLEVLPKVATKDNAFSIEETLRDAVKIVNKEGEAKLLALDGTSLINKMVDYLAVSFYVFVIGEVEPSVINKINDEINKRIEE